VKWSDTFNDEFDINLRPETVKRYFASLSHDLPGLTDKELDAAIKAMSRSGRERFSGDFGKPTLRDLRKSVRQRRYEWRQAHPLGRACGLCTEGWITLETDTARVDTPCDCEAGKALLALVYPDRMHKELLERAAAAKKQEQQRRNEVRNLVKEWQEKGCPPVSEIIGGVERQWKVTEENSTPAQADNGGARAGGV
jgi:hypothetical protein